MGFLGVYRAIYEYQPQSEGELTLNEGDLLLILEKSTEDEWWTAKRKAAGADEDEPEGLIPNTYIEEVIAAFPDTLLELKMLVMVTRSSADLTCSV